MAEIDDLYLILRAQTQPLTESFLTAGSAGEELAAKLSASMAEITASVDRMAENATVASGSIDRMALQAQIDFDRMAAATVAASAKMDAAVASATASNERLGASMTASSSRMSQLKPVVMAGAAAFDIIAIASIKAAADFESATTRLVTSAGEVKSNLDGVRQGILAMAGQVGDSADALAKAMYVIESGGQHGAAGLKELQAAAEGAKAENADLTVVADAVTSVLQDYHLKADDAAMVTSKLVAAVGAGKTTFQDLSGSLHSVLPLASSLHISLDDVAGALASMTVHGMSADQAAQNLNDTIKHMAAPTGVQISELNQLGVSVTGLTDMLGSKGITGTLQYLSETILQHMGPSGRVLLDTFNKSKDAANDVNVMISKMPKNLQDLAHGFQNGSVSLADWRKDLKALPADQANLLAQFASLQNRASGFNDLLKSGSPAAQTYQDALRRVTGDATGLNTALMLTGENTSYVNNAVKTVGSATTEAGNHVKGWSEIQQTFNQKLAQAKASLGALGIEIGQTLLPAATKFFGILAPIAEFLAKHQGLAKALAVAIGILAASLTVATIAMWAMSTTPVFWVIAGITAAVVLLIIGIYELVKHWGTIWGGIKAVAEAVWHALVVAWDAVVSATKTAWDAVFGAVKTAWNAIAGFFKAAWHFVTDPIVAAWHTLEHITSAIWNGISGFFKKWWPLLLLIFAPFIALIMAIWNHFHTQIEAFVRTVWNAIASFLSMVWDGIKVAADAVWGVIRDYIVHPIEEAWHRLVAVWDIVANWLSARWQTISAYAQVVWGEIRHYIIDPIESAWHQVVQFADNIRSAITDALSKAWNWMVGFADKFRDIGWNIVMGIVHGVENAGGHLFDSLKNLANDALNSAKSFLGIGSPSKAFADNVGRWIPHGVAAGVIAAAGVAQAAVASLARSLVGSAQMTVPVGVSANGSMAAGGALAAGVTPRILVEATTPASTSSTPVAAGGGRLVLENHLYIDGTELRNVTIRQTQRTKLRNGASLVT